MNAVVELQVIASGDATDYDATAIVANVARTADVDVPTVRVAIQPGSVIIKSTSSQQPGYLALVAAQALASTLEPSFSSSAAAGAALGVTVESVDLQPQADVIVVVDALLPPPPVACVGTNLKSPGVIIAVAACSAVCLLVFVAAVAIICLRRGRSHAKGDDAAV